MKVQTENYKGIEFIRISKLPEEQRNQIIQDLPSDYIIKILRENELLTDCVQYKHYEAWFDQQYKKWPVIESEKTAKIGSLKLPQN